MLLAVRNALAACQKHHLAGTSRVRGVAPRRSISIAKLSSALLTADVAISGKAQSTDYWHTLGSIITPPPALPCPRPVCAALVQRGCSSTCLLPSAAPHCATASEDFLRTDRGWHISTCARLFLRCNACGISRDAGDQPRVIAPMCPFWACAAWHQTRMRGTAHLPVSSKCASCCQSGVALVWQLHQVPERVLTAPHRRRCAHGQSFPGLGSRVATSSCASKCPSCRAP